MFKINSQSEKLSLIDIYDEFSAIRDLHKIEMEALSYCYDEKIDYCHIFEIDNIFMEKFQNAMKNLNTLSQGN